MRNLKSRDNEFPVIVVTDTESNDKLVLSSFHMPALSHDARRCEWDLLLRFFYGHGAST